MPARRIVRPASSGIRSCRFAELGFRGVLISDELEMKAVAKTHGAGEAAVLAIEAGCDALQTNSFGGSPVTLGENLSRSMPWALR